MVEDAVYADAVSKLEELREEIAAREKANAALRELVASLEGKNQALESALINHRDEITVLLRRLYGTKSERLGTDESQLLLGDILADLAPLQKALDAANGESSPNDPANPKRRTSNGNKRRDLSVSSLPVVEVKLTDPELEKTGRFIGYDDSRELMRIPGGFRVLLKRLAKYEVPSAGEKTVLAAPTPPRLFPRALCHTSVYAWLAVEKFALGVPCHRLEQHLSTEEESLDRGTMCRYLEDLGNTLGATVVEAMYAHARATCHVLSTDATGAAIQPEPNGQKQVTKKGHFFTVIADCDHVFFDFTESHSSNYVKGLFKGFTGFLQSDASSVYDILERGRPDPNDEKLELVGCFAHCRRYFFEAAACKYRLGVEGLLRIQAIYRADEDLRDLPPSRRRERRLVVVKPLVDDFFAWVDASRREYTARNLASKALNYAHNQRVELERVLADGRLQLDNTRSERALRKIVVGRKNWLFYGSGVHAQAAAAIFSIIASCRLHRLDPLAYLGDLLRVLPHWPQDRYIELSPLRWADTRARLSNQELDAPAGFITVPPLETG